MQSPIYSNILNIRMSEAEVVLDFGCIVADAPLTPPVQFDPSVRVIMTIQAIHSLADMFTRAAKAYEEKISSGQQAVPQIWAENPTQKTASQG